MRARRKQALSRSASRRVPILATLSALLVLGCALTSKSEPLVLRYFSPDRASAPARPDSPPPSLTAELRLGHITGASHLDDRILFRDSAFELGYYQERRWTEAPEEYLRRRLERALFEDLGLRHVVGGSAPTLVVELTAFEEIRKPKRVARVQATVRLQDARLVRWEETLTVDQPVSEERKGDAADQMVDALDLALTALVGKIAERVVKELTPPSPPSPTPEPKK